ncbi:hypothetical protein [Streptomyces canus]|nr:hypothetical protein [Streptomyces canus]MDQ0760935.1 hypothetical protein [Streptomyces canus]MDQ1070438.1 hypothetical protein [Streptomyces canus]
MNSVEVFRELVVLDTPREQEVREHADLDRVACAGRDQATGGEF